MPTKVTLEKLRELDPRTAERVEAMLAREAASAFMSITSEQLSDASDWFLVATGNQERSPSHAVRQQRQRAMIHFIQKWVFESSTARRSLSDALRAYSKTDDGSPVVPAKPVVPKKVWPNKKCPSCKYTTLNGPTSLGMHRFRKHGYKSPRHEENKATWKAKMNKKGAAR